MPSHHKRSIPRSSRQNMRKHFGSSYKASNLDTRLRHGTLLSLWAPPRLRKGRFVAALMQPFNPASACSTLLCPYDKN